MSPIGSDDPRQATLAGVINAAVENAVRRLYTWSPAKIVKWDASTGRANCQILVKNVDEDEEGDRTVTSWPVIPGVPVQFMGAGTMRWTCPISDGTLVIGGSTVPATLGSLFFSHHSLDKWLSGDGGEVDPELDHDHALTDAVFIPGLMPFGAPWSDIPTDYMSLGFDGVTGLQVRIKSDAIILAGTEASAQYVALANKVKAWFDAFNLAVGTTWVVTPNDGGGALKIALQTLTSGTPTTDVAASKVKAE